MASVTVSRAGDRLIAVKKVPAAQARDIAREAGTLKRLDHPGVVRFIDVVTGPDGGRALHTEFVSSDTWSTRPLNHPAERAAGVAALAEVVADLHDLGIAHGQINPSHVLHGNDDRPVLCGLRKAAEATPENRQSDLVALADLCHDPEIEPGPLTGKLSALADAARAGRLGARELGRRLDLLLNKGSTATEPIRAAREGTSPRRRARARRRSLTVGAALLSVSAAVLAAGIWSRSRLAPSAPVTIDDRAAPQAPEAADPAAFPAPTVPAAPGADSPAEPSPTSESPGRAPGPVPSGLLLPPIAITEAPGGANESARDRSAAVIEHGGSLYSIGISGDIVETGDWNCDGQHTPAIVRPSTGHVVVFDAWPAPGQSISTPVRWEVDDPTATEAVSHGPCDLLRVYTPAGSKLFDPMGDN